MNELVEIFSVMWLFPIIGWSFDSFLSTKTRKVILVVSSLLFIPMLTEYEYGYPKAYGILGALVASVLFSFSLKGISIERIKFFRAIVFTVILMVLNIPLNILSAFGENKSIEKTWKAGRYRINYFFTEKFEGKPSRYYELVSYSSIPFLIKSEEVIKETESVLKDPCIIDFKKSNLIFNRCTGIVRKN